MIKKLRYLLIVLMVGIDQLVKYVIRQNFEIGESKDVISGIFQIRYIQNTGAAFSILEGKGIFLIVITVVAMLLLVLYMEVNKNDGTFFIITITMMIGGALGNIIDRMFMGYVTDMFDFQIWPVFNVADIFIVVGCILFSIYVLSSGNGKTEAKKLG